jgi:hypothetical protein
MAHAVQGEVWIPLEDWYEFIGKYAPKTDGEILWGEPTQTSSDIVIPFACNTECHPAEQATPPPWAKKK